MRRPILTLGFFLLASSYVRAQQADVETRAMKDEMQRSMKQLHLEGADGPYFIAYKVVDTDTLEAQASLGSLTSSGEGRSRVLSVTVRVGSYDLDNTNPPAAAGGGIAALLGSLGSSAVVLPIDDSYDELRRKIWLATDSAYKRAVEDLSAKKAALESKGRDEKIPDFSKEPARQESEILPPVHEKLADAEHLVRAASVVFRTLPGVQTSEARFEVANSTEHFLNSEGTTYTRQIPELYFHASASMQHTTGEIFNDSCSEYGRSFAELPGEAALVQESQAVVDRLTARQKGHVAKRYNGPVLFEGQSAAELFAHHFAEQLSSHPQAGNGASLLAMFGGSSNSATSSLLNKVGSRVLPEFLTVVDNPQLTQADGHTLFGNYKFDEEGTPSQETVLVKDGFLKTLLTSRRPVRGMLQSTGNMRERGTLPGNLFLDTTKSASEDELKAQMLDLVKSRSLEFGIIIRRLSGNTALECTRVYADGHEEALRDARVAEVTISSFKDVLAVSKDRTVYTERAGINSLAGLLSHSDLVSYVVPDLLFEDMTVEHVPNESPKLPDIPSPLEEK